MASKNLFRNPFDDGTLIKLTLFEHYLIEWLPVFLSAKQPFCQIVNVFDFFAGPGYDINGVKGSPIIILEAIKKYESYIIQQKIQVNVHLNELNTNKYNTLVENLEEYRSLSYINIFHYKADFQSIFKELYPLIKKDKVANLVFLDQNGIKQITSDVFLKLVVSSTTDILFYISSSFFTRFSEHAAFAKHLAIHKDDIDNNNYYNIHRTIFKHYKSLIPFTIPYYLAPFSIKKESNIYGLVFGSHHTLGMEKFLNGCWKLDKIRGEANFDIDNDGIQTGQIDMFSNSVVLPKKIEHFERKLKECIKDQTLKTNYQVYQYSLLNGFLPKHANGVIRQLVVEKIIKENPKIISGDIHKIKNSQTPIILKEWHNQISSGQN